MSNTRFFQRSKVKQIIIRCVFVLLVALLFIVNVLGSFKGLDSPEAMEAASLGREILRGNGLTNKVIYPYSIAKSEERSEPIDLVNHKNTYTAPGHAFVNAAILALVDGADYEKHRVKLGHHVYFLDRALATASVVFLFVAICVFYVLAKQMFDIKIARTVALLMTLSSSMWDFVLSCLPQTFLLMLFGLVLLFFYRAVLSYQLNGKTPWTQLIICAVLLGLMAITKWLTIWIFIGYLAAVLLNFKPKGAVAGLSCVIFLLIITPFLVFNIKHYGTPMGMAGATIANGLAVSEETLIRNLDFTPLEAERLVLSSLETCFSQLSNLVRLMAGFIVAPVFLLSLVHVYRRSSINHIKFGVLLMWLAATFGMAIFGGKSTPMAHQLHILFAPIFAIFGISIVSLMWAKLSISRTETALSNIHLVVIVLLSAGSLLAGLPKQVKDTFESKGRGQPNAPYYQTAELTNSFYEKVHLEKAGSDLPIIYSDQPAATAWYTDVHSIALPLRPVHFDRIEDFAERQGVTIDGIHTSAYSTKHLYENITNLGIMPLVNLPLAQSLTGTSIRPELKALELPLGDDQRSVWERLSSTYPTPVRIINSERRSEMKDFGHHIFYPRIKVDAE